MDLKQPVHDIAECLCFGTPQKVPDFELTMMWLRRRFQKLNTQWEPQKIS